MFGDDDWMQLDFINPVYIINGNGDVKNKETNQLLMYHPKKFYRLYNIHIKSKYHYSKQFLLKACKGKFVRPVARKMAAKPIDKYRVARIPKRIARNRFISINDIKLEGEIWMHVVGYELYMVSSFGRVCSIKQKGVKLLYGNASIEKTSGYRKVNLCSKYKKDKSIAVHRLVAQAFIPNPNGYEIVHHKNGIRDDNRVENLEWCTTEYNSKSENKHHVRINLHDVVLQYIEENNIKTIEELKEKLLGPYIP